MRLWILLLVSACVAGGQEIPVPAIRTELGSMAGAAELAARPEMPDVLRMNDGRRVTTKAEWGKRREELRRVLEYYAVGRMPPAPGNVRGSVVESGEVLNGGARYRLIRLSFGPERVLSLHVGVYTPAGKGPFPAIILQAGTPPGAPVLARLPQGPNQGKGENVLLLVGPGEKAVAPVAGPAQTAEAAAARYAVALGRGYAVAVFNPNDCAEDTTLRNADGSWAFRNTRFYPAYPGYDWGILGGWAWGASRVADYLETDGAIDGRKLIISGVSRHGKAALVAAAFD